jgi:hypothetical protein
MKHSHYRDCNLTVFRFVLISVKMYSIIQAVAWFFKLILSPISVTKTRGWKGESVYWIFSSRNFN